MMTDFKSGVLEIQVINKEIVLGVSVDGVACSLLLSPEEAQKISSVLFQAYLEAQGLKAFV